MQPPPPPPVRHARQASRLPLGAKKSFEARPLSKVVTVMPEYTYKHDFAVKKIQHAFRRWYTQRYDRILSNARDIDPLTRDHVYEIPRANLSVWTVQTRPRRNLNMVVASSINTTMRGYATTDLAMSLLCSTSSSFFHPGLQCTVLPQHIWYMICRVREYLSVLKRQCEALCPVATGLRLGPPSVFGEPLHLIKQRQHVADVLEIIVFQNEMFNFQDSGGRRTLSSSSLRFRTTQIEKKTSTLCNELVRVFTQFVPTVKVEQPPPAATAASKRRRRKVKAAAVSDDATTPPKPTTTTTIVFFNPAEIVDSCEAQNLFDVEVDVETVVDAMISKLRENTSVNVIDFFDIPVIVNDSCRVMQLYNKVTTG